MSIKKKYIVLSGMAIFVMFMPRRMEIAGMYSYRFFILLFSGLGILINRNRITWNGLVNRPFYLVYLTCMSALYFFNSEFVSLIGFLTDIVLIYVLLNTFINAEEDLSFFLSVFLCALTVYSVLCVIETITGFNLWRLMGANVGVQIRYGLSRCFGAFTVPINNGVFLFMSFPLIWYAKEKQFFSKWLFFCNMFVWIALVCTFSRGPILCAFLLHLIVVWRGGIISFVKRNYLLILLSIVILVGLIVLVPQISEMILSFINMFLAVIDPDTAAEISGSFGGNAGGVGQRNMLYSWVWDTLQGHQWVGLGPNATFSYEWKPDQWRVATKTSIENYYLATLYRFGIIGLSALVLFFISELWWNLQKTRTEKKSQGIQFAVLTTIFLYYFVLFTVAAVDDYKMFFILILFSDKIHLFIRRTKRFEYGKMTNEPNKKNN